MKKAIRSTLIVSLLGGALLGILSGGSAHAVCNTTPVGPLCHDTTQGASLRYEPPALPVPVEAVQVKVNKMERPNEYAYDRETGADVTLSDGSVTGVYVVCQLDGYDRRTSYLFIYYGAIKTVFSTFETGEECPEQLWQELPA